MMLSTNTDVFFFKVVEGNIEELTARYDFYFSTIEDVEEYVDEMMNFPVGANMALVIQENKLLFKIEYDGSNRYTTNCVTGEGEVRKFTIEAETFFSSADSSDTIDMA